jgi:hypothetical protein
MKSWTLIVSYLWKDTFSRWLEQPGSPLARWFITTILVAVAAAIMVSLDFLENQVRERMEQFGMNTLLVRETITFSDPELVTSGQRDNRLAPLAVNGSLLRLRQLFVRGKTEWQNDLLVLTYSPSPPTSITQLLSTETPLLCLSTSLPENVLVQVTVNRRSGLAITRHPNSQFRPLSSKPLLLVPQGWLPEEERLGHVETVLFFRDPGSPPMPKIVDAVQQLYATENRAVQIQSPLHFIQSWEALKKIQRRCRAMLAGVLGLALALIYGVISVMEFRQNIFLSALLRSFGVSSFWLWSRQWLESTLLANAAAATALGLLFLFQDHLFNTMRLTDEAVPLLAFEATFGTEILMILAWVNLGALFSSIPVAIGLQRPIGKILN